MRASTLPHKMCPRKQTTEPKLLILVSFFSGEVTSYTDTSYCIHILWEVSRSVFSGPPCISYPKNIRRKPFYLITQTQDLIEYIRNAFIRNMPSVTWMDNATKEAATEKALAIKTKIGFPAWIEDPASLDEYYANVRKIMIIKQG